MWTNRVRAFYFVIQQKTFYTYSCTHPVNPVITAVDKRLTRNEYRCSSHLVRN